MTNKTTKNESTESIESQETVNQQVKTPTNDNKAVFGPLGKYAAVAVIMVSIIVTTAIMLDKQLNSAEQDVAEMENRVAEMNTYNDIATISTDVADAESFTAETQTTAVQAVELKTVDAPLAKTPVVDHKANETQVSSSSQQTEEAIVSETAVSKAVNKDTSNTADQVTAAVTDQAAQIDQQVRVKQTSEKQARIVAYKLEQKQRMAEMFARIKTLESNQLAQYKNGQDNQVARLRKQISQQKTMIDSLILRNKDLFEMRETNIQRHQVRREEILNRI